MEIYGEIKGINYKVFLNKPLISYSFINLAKALSERGNFILEVDKKNNLAISWWLSPKRTRSYPYSRVYDTLAFTGKKITIIPVIKDEGKDGDRDFLQWDTISLMSLLGIYVIVGYYKEAERNPNYENKITNQRFDTEYFKEEILNLLSYQSDALHWNLEQIDKIWNIAEKAFKSYEEISRKTGVEMHSMESAKKHIERLYENKENFIKASRELARKAQRRESLTQQPKERLGGNKGVITIKNYLGGYYYFTCDEVEIKGENIYLIEGKHTNKGILPSEDDIKDGLIKMILYTNLKNVIVDSKEYNPIPILKLTSKMDFKKEFLNESKCKIFNLLKKEAKHNGFCLKILKFM